MAGSSRREAVIPPSTIRVIEVSASRMIVVCPPFYSAAIFSFVLSAVMFVSVWFAAGRDLGVKGTLILLASNAPFLVVSVGLATTSAAAVLDSKAGFLQIRSRVAGITTQQRSFHLASVESSIVQTSKGSRRLGFQLQDGSVVGLGFFTSQAGHNVSAVSINRFLRQARTAPAGG